jgi:hypothetical protein
MKLKYSPCSSSRDTRIEVVSASLLSIEGEPYEFAAAAVAWPGIAEQTGGAIIEAHREDGELCLTVLRRYSGPRPQWDDGEYHEVTEGEIL